MRLTRKDFYRGTETRSTCYVLGWQFGPVLVAAHTTLEDALDEFDERHGTRVLDNDVDLRDYDGETLDEKFDAAMNCGDIRVNGGGTVVWVDPYEWVREFQNVRAARAFFNSWGRN